MLTLQVEKQVLLTYEFFIPSSSQIYTLQCIRTMTCEYASAHSLYLVIGAGGHRN